MNRQRQVELHRQIAKLDELIEIEQLVLGAWTLTQGRREQETRMATLKRVRDGLVAETQPLALVSSA